MSAATGAAPPPLAHFPEVLEASGELELVCLICTKPIPATETVTCWRMGRGSIVVAHIECASEAVPEARS